MTSKKPAATTTAPSTAAQLDALAAAVAALMIEVGGGSAPMVAAPAAPPAPKLAATAYARGMLTIPETAPNPAGSVLRFTGAEVVAAGKVVATFGPFSLAYAGLIETKAGPIRHKYATDPMLDARAPLSLK